MGNFNNLYTFISNRVLPRSNSSDSHDSNKENFFPSHRRHHSDSAPHSLAQKESIQQLFPCEDKHSFNPHYQHNLHFASPFYSTPPSLSSSPTNASPSSTASSSSSSSSSSHSSHRSYYHHTQPRNARQHYFQQQKLHKQQQQQQLPLHQHQHQRNHSYSYTRQQGRKMNQRYLSDQSAEYMDDEDMMVDYDHQQIYYGSGSSTSMTRVHPQGSSSYFGSSVPSAMDRQNRHRRRTSHISVPSSRSENERASSRSLSNVVHGSNKSHNHIQTGHQWLPCISETTATMYMHVHNSDDVVDDDEQADAHSLGHRESNSALSASSTSSAPLTAKQSLMRIARCDPRQDSCCSQKAGQWTRHYAEGRQYGLVADGRRARRF
ncbi:MAG: hypothetical protein J3Q66DRAFT_339912 [Benniella sp.]|nr:MAG: hypothetical protein J3Q66DRAFT_339912 [Benniella sp.]